MDTGFHSPKSWNRIKSNLYQRLGKVEVKLALFGSVDFFKLIKQAEVQESLMQVHNT